MATPDGDLWMVRVLDDAALTRLRAQLRKRTSPSSRSSEPYDDSYWRVLEAVNDELRNRQTPEEKEDGYTLLEEAYEGVLSRAA